MWSAGALRRAGDIIIDRDTSTCLCSDLSLRTEEVDGVRTKEEGLCLVGESSSPA